MKILLSRQEIIELLNMMEGSYAPSPSTRLDTLGLITKSGKLTDKGMAVAAFLTRPIHLTTKIEVSHEPA